MSYILAIDLGASRTRIAVFDHDTMSIVAKVSTHTPQTADGAKLAHQVASTALSLVKSVGGGDVVAVGVGSVGPLDVEKGVIVNPPNLAAKHVPLREVLEEVFNVPVYVVNDCVAAVYGEYRAGVARNYRNVVYLTISTGIGAGVIVDGHLLIGKDGNAHEVGHIVVAYNMPIRCECGGVGHWEALASGKNIWKLARLLATSWTGNETPFYIQALREPIDPPALFKAWREGDEFAAYVVAELIQVNAAGIASVVNAYDPEILVIGGSIALNNPDFILAAAREARKYVTNRMPKVELTRLGDNVVTVGAAWIAKDPPPHLASLAQREGKKQTRSS
jgi:glucokinase